MYSKTEMWKCISKNLKKYRSQNGLSQQELADRIHISYGHYRKVEAENVVSPCSLELLLDIANELDIHIKTLFD